MKELLRVAPAILLGALAATCSGQAPAKVPTAPGGIAVVSDLQYSEARRDRRQNQLDLYLAQRLLQQRIVVATTVPTGQGELRIRADLAFASGPPPRVLTLVSPAAANAGQGMPLLVLAVDASDATAALSGARALAQDGLAVAIVPLADATGDRAASQFADALRWLADQRAQFGFLACTLGGIGAASTAALLVARVDCPLWPLVLGFAGP